jgi:hypothetical protein
MIHSDFIAHRLGIFKDIPSEIHRRSPLEGFFPAT